MISSLLRDCTMSSCSSECTYGVLMEFQLRLWSSYYDNGLVTKLSLHSYGDHAFHVRPAIKTGVSKCIQLCLSSLQRICRVHHHGRRYPKLANTATITLCPRCRSVSASGIFFHFFFGIVFLLSKRTTIQYVYTMIILKFPKS